MAMVYIGVGTNLGDRAAHLEAAFAGLAALPETLLAGRAGVYETAPQGGPPGQGAFLNSAAALDTRLDPAALLAALHGIERRIGRRREAEAVRWGPRVIDLDILLWDDTVYTAPDLVIPHPRLAEREFALRPLADLAGEARHPVLGLTVRELLDGLTQRNATPS